MKAGPRGSIEVHREDLIDEITQTISEDVSNRIANPSLTTAFAGHPYGAPVGGVTSDVAAMTLASVRAFERAHSVPRAAVEAFVSGRGFQEPLRTATTRSEASSVTVAAPGPRPPNPG